MIAHMLVYVSLCKLEARYGAREGRELGVRWERRCQDFAAGLTCLSQIALSQAASYTRTWGHGDMLSYSRKIKLTSRLVHRHVLGYISRSAWRIGKEVCSSQTRESLLTAAAHINIIEARALRNLQCQQRIRGLEKTPCRASTILGLLL